MSTNSTAAGLFKVASSGGSPQMIGPTEKLKELQGTAQRNFLPGSHALLVSIRGENASERRIQVLTSADGGLRGRYLSSRDPSMVTMPIESSTTQPPTAGFWRCARAEGRATTRYESSPIGSRR